MLDHEEKGYLLPTWAQKITCQRFDWMLLMTTGAFGRNIGIFQAQVSTDNHPLSIYAEAEKPLKC